MHQQYKALLENHSLSFDGINIMDRYGVGKYIGEIFCAQSLEKRHWIHFRPVFLRSFTDTPPVAASMAKWPWTMNLDHMSSIKLHVYEPLLED